ncbi:MAG: DNA helicase RecQ [Acidobacteria bacterium]|nr:DNA helicase RecQ [Acidobacteriota bacterium]MCB9397592.1 DNA helicase RecQ [Acidobacteriota bacterium]
MNPVAPKRQLAEKALAEIWGYSQFRPFQWETIQAILQAKDSLTILPTGGGKSLCYQLPAILGSGTALVVSPLIALMADQVRSLRILGIPAAFLNSTVSPEEARAVWQQLRNGELKLLYVAPERLMTESFCQALERVDLSFIAIDEAHCISQWGHDFRPEYRNLNRIRSLFPDLGIHAFTATATPQVQSDILSQLGLRQPETWVGDYFRPNLLMAVKFRKDGRQQLLNELEPFKKESGIVYCLTRKTCEQISQYLNQNGWSSLPYHAGLDAPTRTLHQESFAAEKIRTMVATVAFGMGVDQSNLRYVIHYGLPQSLSHYQQEAGRAGRDGLPAQCTLLYNTADIVFWQRLLSQEEGASFKLPQLQSAIQYATRPTCRHRTLVEHFGQAFSRNDCQACDVCRGEIKAIGESRPFAQMILSAALRLKESFGGEYVAQVLSGSQNHRLTQNGHDQLSVYGLLKRFPLGQIRDWIGQLESQKYLFRDPNQFNVLRVTAEGLGLLKPEKVNKTERDFPVFLLQTQKSKTKKKVSQMESADQQLFDRLKVLRREIALELGVPAFVVFGDKTLTEIAAHKPQNKDELLAISGIGSHKAAQFGDKFLQEIQEYVAETS